MNAKIERRNRENHTFLQQTTAGLLSAMLQLGFGSGTSLLLQTPSRSPQPTHRAPLGPPIQVRLVTGTQVTTMRDLRVAVVQMPRPRDQTISRGFFARRGKWARMDRSRPPSRGRRDMQLGRSSGTLKSGGLTRIESTVPLPFLPSISPPSAGIISISLIPPPFETRTRSKGPREVNHLYSEFCQA